MKIPFLRPSQGGSSKRNIGLLLALPLLLMAAWCAWSAWQLRQAKAAETAAEQARASVAQMVGGLISKEQQVFMGFVKSPAMALAVSKNDWASATQALSQAWEKGSDVSVFGADLNDQYASVSSKGFALVAIAEAVLLDEKPAAILVRSGKSQALALAAPLSSGEQVVGVAYGQVPIKGLMEEVNSAGISQGSYLALRQGNASVVEAGDQNLADFADNQSTPIKGSNLRVVSASIEAPPGPFGFGETGCWIAAILGVGLALLSGSAPLWAHKLKKLKRRSKTALPEQEEEVSLATFMEQNEKSPLVRPAHVPEQSVKMDPNFNLSAEAKTLLSSDPFGSEGIVANQEVSTVFGQVLGAWLVEQGVSRITMGGDAPNVNVKKGLEEGLVLSGLQVSPVEETPHPFVLFAASELHSAAITLEELNTLRTRLRLFLDGKPLGQSEFEALNKALRMGQISKTTPGSSELHSVEENYQRKLLDEVSMVRPVRIKLQGEHEALASRILSALGAHIASADQEAEITVSLSDQGTALTVSDGTGSAVSPERLLRLLAVDLLQRSPGALVVCDEQSSGTLSSDVLSMGGVLKVCAPGVEALQEKVIENNAVLGGDSQGHINFAAHAHAMPDGLYAAARFLEIVAAAYHADDILES